jgi:uncharacterized protein (DUF427 family)
MTDHIKIRPAAGTWVVRAAGAVLGESNQALAVTQDDHPTVIYFPRADIAMAFLDATDRQSTCPFKGTARHYSIIAKSGEMKDAAWSYESPYDDAAQITGYLAFDTAMVAVEQV